MPSKSKRSASLYSLLKSLGRAFKAIILHIFKPSRPSLRRILALISIVVFLLIAPYTVYRYATTSQYFNPSIVIQATPFNDLTNASIQTRVNLSTNLFQVGLLVAAGLGGLLITKDVARGGEVNFVLSEYPEIIMFTCAILLVLSSLVFHYFYLGEISYICHLASKFYDAASPDVPDVTDENISFLLDYQFRYLISGVLLTVMTFLSAHIVKGGKGK